MPDELDMNTATDVGHDAGCRQGGKIWRPHVGGVDQRKEVTELTISFWEQTFILPPFPLVPFL